MHSRKMVSLASLCGVFTLTILLAESSATLASSSFATLKVSSNVISPLGPMNQPQAHTTPSPSPNPMQQRINAYYADGSFPKAGRSPAQKIEEAKAFLKTEIPKTGSVGVSVSVVYKDQVVISEGYGTRLSNDSSSLVSKDSLFQIGSVTKTFVALAIGLLVEDGRVQWEDTVKQHIPWLQLYDKYAENYVTIGNMLSMNSGFDRFPDTPAYAGAYNSSRALIEAIANFEPDHSLRETPSYANINYDILGQLIEEVSGKPWYEFVGERILKPLGMTSTYASIGDVPDAIRKKSLNAAHNVCKGKVLGPIDVEAREVQLTPSVPRYAPGSMVSSATDMGKVLRLILNKGKMGNATLFKSASTIATMVTGKNVAATDFLQYVEADALDADLGLHYEPDGATFSAGYGFDVVGHLAWGRAYFDKGGDTLVHHTLTGFVPNDALGVAILSNSDAVYELAQCRGYLLGIFLDVPKEILDFEFKKWRAITNQPGTPLFPGMPECGLPFWTNPPRLTLSLAEVDALVGDYTAITSAQYMPTVKISRGVKPDEYDIVMGLLKGTFVYATNVDTYKVLIPVGPHSTALMFSVLIPDGGQPPGFVVQLLNTFYAKQTAQ